MQGPGCLNYAVVLSLERRPALASAPESYGILLGQVARALGVPGVQVCGSDILLECRKISGNAQRRIRGWLLHHGTILYGIGAEPIERFLLEPPRQPPHRGGRTHGEFVSQVQMKPEDLKQRIASAFRGPDIHH